MEYAQIRIHPENATGKILLDFELQSDHFIPARRPDQATKKRTCQIVDFAIRADHREKIKENEKRGKYLYLARELKKLQNMQVMVISIVIGVLIMIPKDLVKKT